MSQAGDSTPAFLQHQLYSEFPAEDLAQQIYRESLIQQVRYISPLEEETSNIFGWKWSFTVAVQAISRDFAGELRNVEDEVTQDFSVARQSAEGRYVEKVVHITGTALQG